MHYSNSSFLTSEGGARFGFHRGFTGLGSLIPSHVLSCARCRKIRSAALNPETSAIARTLRENTCRGVLSALLVDGSATKIYVERVTDSFWFLFADKCTPKPSD